ncbi:hypothetical protein [Dyella sp. A6]|uniref:hypothetical protein n=1 Tax=Dyella aluminiiresistens TaxID=3069105 RepID=UPI002E79577E|nr:hypothetical protein [Dyella sp. A6]
MYALKATLGFKLIQSLLKRSPTHFQPLLKIRDVEGPIRLSLAERYHGHPDAKRSWFECEALSSAVLTIFPNVSVVAGSLTGWIAIVVHDFY